MAIETRQLEEGRMEKVNVAIPSETKGMLLAVL